LLILLKNPRFSENAKKTPLITNDLQVVKSHKQGFFSGIIVLVDPFFVSNCLSATPQLMTWSVNSED